MDIIASCAFSTKVDSHNDPNNEFLRYARTVFGGKVNWRFVVYSKYRQYTTTLNDLRRYERKRMSEIFASQCEHQP